MSKNWQTCGKTDQGELTSKWKGLMEGSGRGMLTTTCNEHAINVRLVFGDLVQCQNIPSKYKAAGGAKITENTSPHKNICQANLTNQMRNLNKLQPSESTNVPRRHPVQGFSPGATVVVTLETSNATHFTNSSLTGSVVGDPRPIMCQQRIPSVPSQQTLGRNFQEKLLNLKRGSLWRDPYSNHPTKWLCKALSELGWVSLFLLSMRNTGPEEVREVKQSHNRDSVYWTWRQGRISQSEGESCTRH